MSTYLDICRHMIPKYAEICRHTWTHGDMFQTYVRHVSNTRWTCLGPFCGHVWDMFQKCCFPKSADSSACWNQSRPADQPTSRPTDLQTSSHLSTIHTRPSNPDETTSSLLLWGKPYAIFLRGRGEGAKRSELIVIK